MIQKKETNITPYYYTQVELLDFPVMIFTDDGSDFFVNDNRIRDTISLTYSDQKIRFLYIKGTRNAKVVQINS